MGLSAKDANVDGQGWHPSSWHPSGTSSCGNRQAHFPAKSFAITATGNTNWGRPGRKKSKS